MAEKARCIYCDGPAVRWCDFILGFTDPDGDGLFSFEDGSDFLRCDAPLCTAHARHVGNFFISGRRPVAGCESIDHCCTHPLSDDDGYFVPLAHEQAEQIRYRHRCLARGGLKLVGGG